MIKGDVENVLPMVEAELKQYLLEQNRRAQERNGFRGRYGQGPRFGAPQQQARASEKRMLDNSQKKVLDNSEKTILDNMRGN